jgi:hypothetical protein
VLFEHITTNMDLMIGVHAEDVRIERCVVNSTEGQSVRNLGKAPLLPIGKNVRGVQELPMTKGAHAATTFISSHNKLAESSLVQANFDGPHRVRSLNLELGRSGFSDRP